MANTTVDEPSESRVTPGDTTTTSMTPTTTKGEGQGDDGQFTLLLFASASTYANDTETISFSAPMSLEDLFDELETRYPGIGNKVLCACAVTVNLEYLDVDVEKLVSGVGRAREKGKSQGGSGQSDALSSGVVLRKGDEVAIIPPVSSG